MYLRVRDTDQSAGARGHDSVEVDFLQIVEGGEETPDPPEATSMTASLSTSLQSAGKGQQYGVAQVLLLDNLGAPVPGVDVSVELSGSFNETLTGTTQADGRVTLRSSASGRRPSFSACVRQVTGSSLSYVAGGEACPPL